MAKANSNLPVTNKTLREAVDSILNGVDEIIKEERKFNIQTFATKEDLKKEISWIKDDVKGLSADLSGTVSKKEFKSLQVKVDKYLSN